MLASWGRTSPWLLQPPRHCWPCPQLPAPGRSPWLIPIQGAVKNMDMAQSSKPDSKTVPKAWWGVRAGRDI